MERKIIVMFIVSLAQVFLCKSQVTITPVQIKNMIFDYIIVGGGSGGATVASRLSERPDLKVLLIEAGGFPRPLNGIPGFFRLESFSVGTWKYPIEPQTECFRSFQDQKFSYIQGKTLGGGSSINGMVYVRGSKKNYDDLADLGLTEWSYDKVLPYYIKAEGNTIPGQMENKKYHGTDGPLTVSKTSHVFSAENNFVKGSEEIGLPLIDYNLENKTGVSPLSFTIRNGSRCSTYVAYLSKSPTKTNLFLSINSIATKVLFNQTTANGVEFLTDGQLFTAKATREVILSAGSLASPKILMHSGIGPKNQLEKFNIPVLVDLPGVGENLQDHMGVFSLVWKLNCTDCTFPFTTALSLESFEEYARSNDGPLSASGGPAATAFINTKHSPDYPDVQLFYFPNSIVNTPIMQLNSTNINLEVKKYFAPFLNATSVMTIAVTQTQPKSRGHLRLNSSDPLAYPTVNFNFMKEPIDVYTLVEGSKKAKLIGDSEAFKSLGAEFIPGHYPGCEAYELYSDDYWNCTVRGLNYVINHASGTCKMGIANDTMAVVDQNLKVFGVENLRVVDASVMTVIPSANTNAPTIMIGEKAADIILSKIQ